MKSLQEILNSSADYLKRQGSPSPRSDAEWLLADALNLSKLDLYVQFERPLNEEELQPVRAHLKRRAQGEPVQYIIGSTEFYGYPFMVGPGTLIPRPETERLIDFARERAADATHVLDLCCGSGCIILTLAQELKAPETLIGVDISEEALAWAEKNRTALDLPQVELLVGDLFSPVSGQEFSLITANPPYVTRADYQQLERHIADHEPEQALAAGDDGLDIIRRIAANATDHLTDGGWLFCEIGDQQGPQAAALFKDAGLKTVEVLQDYARKDRIVAAQR